MVKFGVRICPECQGELKFYDKVKRIVRGSYGRRSLIKLNRLICIKCGKTHREISRGVYPYKHFEKRIIDGFLKGYYNSSMLEFEDYPCESTIRNWNRMKKTFYYGTKPEGGIYNEKD